MAINTSITVFRGEDATILFSMDPAEDITGWTLLFNVSKKADSSVKLVDDKAVVITDPTLGKFQVPLSTAELDLKAGTYFWDVWRVDTGVETVLGYGSFIVSGNARKPE